MDLTRADLKVRAIVHINAGMCDPDKIASRLFSDLNGQLNGLMNELILHELRELVRMVIHADRNGGSPQATSHRQSLVATFGMLRPYHVPHLDDWRALKDLTPRDTESVAEHYFGLAAANKKEGDRFMSLRDEMRKRHAGTVAKLPPGLALEILQGSVE